MSEAQAQQADASVTSQGGSARVALKGRLDANSVAGLWDRVVPPVRDSGFSTLTVDGKDVSYCDGAGIGLLMELALVCRARKASISYEGLNEDLRLLLEKATPAELPPPAATKPDVVSSIGLSASSVLSDLYGLIEFLGESIKAFGWAITHPTRVRWADVLLVCERAGVNALPVVMLLGFLMGLIIAFQTATPLQEYGAVSQIPVLMGLAMVRELGPLTTAIILAGRSGSAFAAEIGTMKVTQELDALNTFGVRPMRFLVVPRVLAAMIMTPLLANFCTLMGLLGGIPTMLSFGYTLQFYIEGVRSAVGPEDLLQGLFKAVIFAFVIGAVGCQRGLKTGSGPGAVGRSTTSAVVAGIVLIVVVDGLLGVVFFYLRL
ncbi:MAG: ABC transporter permease [Phycisphaerae bacterium]|nr:ABC transporter permease [Phycisphaerae bacterium]